MESCLDERCIESLYRELLEKPFNPAAGAAVTPFDRQNILIGQMYKELFYAIAVRDNPLLRFAC